MNDLLPEGKSGIYQIRNTVNNKKYIGSARCFRIRWQRHRNRLRANKHHSKILQRAWNKYGEDKFVFEIILECEVEELLAYEQLCLDEECPEYNICKFAGSSLGVTHSEETKRKLAEISRNISDITRRKIAEAGRGRKHSEETKKKMSQAALGRKVSEATKQKMREVAKNRPAEINNKISEARKGSIPWNKGRTHSEETKRKISERAKGRIPWNKGKTGHE